MKTKRISNGTSGKIGICIIRWVVFALIAFVVLMPVYWIFISSITPPGELFKSPIEYLPKHPSLESYQFLVSHVGLLEKIRKYYNDYTALSRNHGNVVLAALGNDAGIYGAVRLVMKKAEESKG